MAFLKPFFVLELIQGLKNSLRTYAVCSMRVSKVACKIDLVRLHLLEKRNDDVDVGLGTFALLDSARLIERKVEEVGVGLVVETE